MEGNGKDLVWIEDEFQSISQYFRLFTQESHSRKSFSSLGPTPHYTEQNMCYCAPLSIFNCFYYSYNIYINFFFSILIDIRDDQKGNLSSGTIAFVIQCPECERFF